MRTVISESKPKEAVMRRLIFLSVLVSAIFSVLVLPSAVAAEDEWYGHGLVRSAIQAGGERLEALQNPDGGWFFTVGDTDCGFGAGVSCRNTVGVTGLGLLSSLNAKPDKDVKAAARATGDALVTFFNAGPACDNTASTKEDRPYSQDVEFLVSLSQNGFGGKYQMVAKKWFACTMGDFPIANDRVSNRIDRRGGAGLGIANLAGWDTASDIRAARATGNHEYAKALARAIVSRESEWNFNNDTGYELYSMASLIWAIQPHGDGHALRDAVVGYRDTLLGLQASDGSWVTCSWPDVTNCFGDTQLTAYVVLGFEALPGGHGVKMAIKDAVAFLLSQMNADGGYNVVNGGSFASTEITEVDGEVLQALAALHGDD